MKTQPSPEKSEKKITIGLVEDQFLFRQGMKAILGTWPDLEVVFESPEGYSVVDKIKAGATQPDVMLVDLSLPPKGKEEFSGKEVTLALREHFPDVKIIILSGHEDENFIADLIESGAHGYLVKDSDPGEVREAIVSVCTKGSYINIRALRAIQNNMGRKRERNSNLSPGGQLTSREEEILQLICRQLTTEQIAEELSISPKTVNGYRISLLEKTGAINVAGLTLFAIRNGIVKV
jgi:DNA-binding NarL/FixJ family response regulator